MIRMKALRSAFVLAPVLLGSYGVIRIIDGLDGSRGPGLAWTTGHLCFLVALVFFVKGFWQMRALAGRSLLATTGLCLGVTGAVAVGVQYCIDLGVGFISANRDAMDVHYQHIQALPGVEPLFFSVGPLLFFVGQFMLVAQLAAQRHLKFWAPVLVLIDTTFPFADKNLIPLGAALLLISYTPLIRRAADPRPASDPQPADTGLAKEVQRPVSSGSALHGS
jgi:hypothetical protein